MTRKASDKSTARLKAEGEAKTTVKFIGPHTHAGRQYEKGDELEADPGLVARLKRFGVIDEGKRHATDENDKD